MSLRAEILDGIKAAMKTKDEIGLSTLRLVNAAIKDRDIAVRAQDRPEGIDEKEILTLLAKMVKQREESAKIYESNARPELAEREHAEIAIIKQFMPKPLSEKELEKAVKDAIEASNASGLKDMGKVMGALKSNYAGRIDMGKAGGLVKSMLMG